MTSDIEVLMSEIKGMKFYYSLPLKTAGTDLIINPFISGSMGFSKDFFADKFFINITPESERLLVNLTDFFNNPSLTATSVKAPDSKEDTAKKAMNDELATLETNLATILNSLNSLNSIEEVTIDFLEDIKGLLKAIKDFESKFGALQALDDTVDSLNQFLKDYNDSIAESDPILMFMADTRITIDLGGVPTQVSPFEDMNDIINHVRANVGEQYAQEIVDKLNKIISDPMYVKNRNTEKILNTVYKNLGIDIQGGITTMKLIRALFPNPRVLTSNPASFTKVQQYFSDIVEKLNKCK